MAELSVKVEKLTINYGNISALWELNFEVPLGNLVGVIGPTGAGKSTLLKALLGLQKPTSGSLHLPPGKKIAYVPQRTSVDWDFPIRVLDVVLMGRYEELGLLKWPRRQDRRKAEEVLERVGMLEFAHRQISALSGGQQQRVFLARALLQNADLYFMDEPFAGIDMATEKALVEILTSLKKEGKTLFIVHHDLTTVKSYFDWTILLNCCLIASGPVEEVFTESNLKKTYGTTSYLVTEVNKLSREG